MKTMSLLLATFMLSRYAVSVDPADSAETTAYPTVIELLIGSGSYAQVTRDCSGHVTSVTDVPYSEWAISASHTVSVVKFGVTGGVTTSPRTADVFTSTSNVGVVLPDGSYRVGKGNSSFPYVAPQIGLNMQYVSLDVGYLFDLSSRPVSSTGQVYYFSREAQRGTWIGGIRLGRLDRTYFYVDYGMNVPLSIGSGVAQIGLGFGSTTGGPRFCLGLGAIPDESLMIGGKGDIPVSRNVVLCVRGHIAPENGFAYGVAGGVKFRF